MAGAKSRGFRAALRKAKELAAKEEAGKKKAAEGVKAAGRSIANMGAKAAVKRSAKQEGRVVSEKTTGLPNVRDLSKMDKLELEFDKLTKTAQRSIISKARKGEPTKYGDMLELRKGIEREGKTAERKARQAQAVKEFKDRQAVEKKRVNRKSGSKMVKKPKGVGCATHGYGKAMK